MFIRLNIPAKRYFLACWLVCYVLQAQISREPNNTLNLPAEPPQEAGSYVLRDAFPGLYFNKPVAIRTPRGETDRIFIVERDGRILIIENLGNPTLREFMDIRDRVVAGAWSTDIESRRTEGLSSIAFHPNFRLNGRFFVTYNLITSTSQGNGHHNRLSEFRATGNPRVGDPNSEIPLITQFDEGPGHNINDAHFGPDGYLYVASGDEGDGGNGDDYRNAQKIDKDFFSGILRIDVDKRSGNFPPNQHPAASDHYAVPADNPFVGISTWQGSSIDSAKVRDEFWAIGLRNPWRISFDPANGNLYAGDVGQHGREEINRIVRGGNYGWSFREGELTGPGGNPPEGVDLIAPLYRYGIGTGPNQGYSVTGGVVYRGTRLPQLAGHLVFADFVSGNIWTLNVDAGGEPARILGEAGIAGFGYDSRNGDVLLVNHNSGVLKRLDVSSGSGTGLPQKLSETGIFSDLVSLTPHRGIYPYEVNLSFWSDGALKKRWFTMPSLEQKIQFSAEGPWSFPKGTTWIKHFELETVQGDPSSRKRVETRVIVKMQTGIYGLTYKWNESGTDAELVPDLGAESVFTILENGASRPQTWRFPSRQDCLTCHTAAGGLALGFNTPQLNLSSGQEQASSGKNQIIDFASAGFFSNPPSSVAGLRSLARLDDESISRTFRVKSYLEANCAYCHQPGGTADATWDGRISTALSRANLVRGELRNNNGDATNRVVVPGDLDHSVLLKRISTFSSERMPPLGSSVLDSQAIQLLSAWINEDLDKYETYDQWRGRVFAGQAGVDSTAEGDPDGDCARNYAEYLAKSDPVAKGSIPVSSRIEGNATVHSFTNPPNVGVLLESSREMNNPWELKETPQNRLHFPASALPREFSVPIDGSKEFYRLRLVEP